MSVTPKNLQLIGTEIAILWSDGTEDYFSSEFLRKHSPSAENKGETDILGNTYGGTTQTDFPGVVVTRWDFIGNYAVRFHFSDGHRTGLFSYSYLQSLRNASSE